MIPFLYPVWLLIAVRMQPIIQRMSIEASGFFPAFQPVKPRRTLRLSLKYAWMTSACSRGDDPLPSMAFLHHVRRSNP